MKSYRRRIALLLAVFALASCGKSAVTVREVHSLDEAKALAAESGTFIVMEFWRPT